MPHRCRPAVQLEPRPPARRASALQALRQVPGPQGRGRRAPRQRALPAAAAMRRLRGGPRQRQQVQEAHAQGARRQGRQKHPRHLRQRCRRSGRICLNSGSAADKSDPRFDHSAPMPCRSDPTYPANGRAPCCRRYLPLGAALRGRGPLQAVRENPQHHHQRAYPRQAGPLRHEDTVLRVRGGGVQLAEL